MKKIEKVSIANISFTLDNDAYASLRQYLDSLQNYYGNDPDGGEIIADIEARIAELILTEQVYTKTVAKSLVDTIVAQLGSPEQIDDEVGDIAVSGPEAAAGSKATANLDSGAAYSAYSDGVVSGSESAVGSNDAANSMNSEGGAAYSAYSDGVATGSNSAVADYDGAAAAEKPGTHDGASGVRQGGAPGGASGAEGSSDTHAEKQRGASGAERPSGTQSTEKSTPGRPAAQPDPSIPRRLHRSGERRVFGGVCGGMSRYFSIDVIWIRLAFLFPAICRILVAPIDNYFVDEFFEGWSWVFFVTYIVLWVALPMARTPRQKLEARGERITPESIRQNLQVAASTPSGRKAASVTAEMITVFGRIVLFFIRFIAATVGFSLLIAAMGIIVGMVFVATENGGILDMANVAWFANASSVVPVWFIEIVLLCVLLPIFAVGMALLSAVFGWRLRRAFFAVVLGLWACVMILTGAVAIGNAKHLKQQFSRENMYWFYDDHDYDYDFELDLDEGGWRWHEEIRRDDRHHHVVRPGRRSDGRPGRWSDGQPGRREIRIVGPDSAIDSLEATSTAAPEGDGASNTSDRDRVDIRIEARSEGEGEGEGTSASDGDKNVSFRLSASGDDANADFEMEVADGEANLTITHRVKPSETIGHIAVKYDVTVAQLKQWNNLKSDRLSTGQQLKIHR